MFDINSAISVAKKLSMTFKYQSWVPITFQEFYATTFNYRFFEEEYHTQLFLNI